MRKQFYKQLNTKHTAHFASWFKLLDMNIIQNWTRIANAMQGLTPDIGQEREASHIATIRGNTLANDVDISELTEVLTDKKTV